MRRSSEKANFDGKTFKEQEKHALLNLPGVGPSVIRRLEEIGIYSFEQLREYDACEITSEVSSSIGSTCWKNSPQAKKAIEAAIKLADETILGANY